MGRWRWRNLDRRTKKMSPLKTPAKWFCLGRLGIEEKVKKERIREGHGLEPREKG